MDRDFDSFCMFRMPDSDSIQCYKGFERTGINPGFVVAPFDLRNQIYTISDLQRALPAEFKEIINDDTLTDYAFPEESTTKERHRKIVEGIQDILAGDTQKKIIASRVIIKAGTIDIENSFSSLCSTLPDAFIFLFYSPHSGIWIGASPELLLRSKDQCLKTYALAGTRPLGENMNWDSKNIREQEIVKNYIINVLQSFGFSLKTGDTVTKRAGSIEHLLTEIFTDGIASNDLEVILRTLSPTPALSGYPKEEAMDTISRLEHYPRGFYGGFIGPYDSPEDFTFYVNLRSVRISEDKYCMQVGGGITALSNPEEEWLETERKSQSIISNIITN